MQRLNRGMLSRYEIPERTPSRVNAVQFGTDAVLLGLIDRMVDRAGLDIGIACVQVDQSSYADKLKAQEGLFTTLVRGYLNDVAMREEVVVQSVLRALDSDADFEAIMALAKVPEMALGLMHTESEDIAAALGLAARFLLERYRAGLAGLQFICIGETPHCAQHACDLIAKIAESWPVENGFVEWLCTKNAFYPALADNMVSRSAPDEAAMLCADMNYADAMIHIAEPYAALIVQAPEAFRAQYPLDRAAEVCFVDDLAPELLKKHRIFDAGLFVMAAPGYLAGCDTLNDCMKHPELRAYIGHAYFDEIIPSLPFTSEEITPYVIAACERFENPLNRNYITEMAHHLFSKFVCGVLPMIRTWVDENYEAPRRLGFALAATIMLYAGVRLNVEGAYEVVRGTQMHELKDDLEILRAFALLAHDMPAESLTYAVLADRNLWNGDDLREIDGLESRVMFDIAAIQKNPSFIPDTEGL